MIWLKNIAIFESSRSGKSTLSKRISRKYPNYHIIIGDDIRWAFQETLPNNNINSKGGIGMVEDFPNFLSCLFYKSIKRNKGIFNYIVETCDMTPQKAYELFNKDDTILLFLGTPNQTVEYHFEEIRKYETERDWTYNCTDEDILEHSKYWVTKSKDYQKECKKLNIWFIDTSFNRTEILENTFHMLEKMILEKK